MKAHYQTIFVLITLFGLADISQAQQADFTFTVPISVTNLHQHVDEVGVEVFVCAADPSFPNPPSVDGGLGCAIIGTNRESTTVDSNGKASTTLTVHVNAGDNAGGYALWNGIPPKDQDPARATYWAARIIIHNAQHNRWTIFHPEGSGRPIQERLNEAASTSFVKAKGPIPSN